MPEGPEIRLAADRIAKVLVGQDIIDSYFAFQWLRRPARKLTGSTVTAVDTRGKAMLTRFDNGLTLYNHNQLYGRRQLAAFASRFTLRAIVPFCTAPPISSC